MQHLTPDQAQALWDAGGFIILPDLPEGSEYGLDGTYHTIRKSFSGSKFVPPGIHLITISTAAAGGADSSANLGPGTIPLRSGILVVMRPRERVVLSYDASTESLVAPCSILGEKTAKVESLISDDHLRTLDPGLAAYPFEGLERWKSISGEINLELLAELAGQKDARGVTVDGLMSAEGGEEDSASTPSALGAFREERKLPFPKFDLRRSWPEGSVGEERTSWSNDKSKALELVLTQRPAPSTIVGYLQVAFVFLLHLSSPACLQVYKRLVSLLCRSQDIHIHPPPLASADPASAIRDLYIGVVYTLAAQLVALPDNVFDSDLPELDVWYNEELECLRRNIAVAIDAKGGLWLNAGRDGVTSTGAVRRIGTGWDELIGVAQRKFGWQLEALSSSAGLGEEEEDEDEEGEYAPVIVET